MRTAMKSLLFGGLLIFWCADPWAATGKLNVQAFPKDAEIWVGDRRIEQPLQPVEEGGYRLEIKKKGYFPYEEEIRIEPGETLDLGTIELTLLPADWEKAQRSRLRKVKFPLILSFFEIQEGLTSWNHNDHGNLAFNLALGASVEQMFFGAFGVRARYFYLPINLTGRSSDWIKEKGYRLGVPLYLHFSATDSASARGGSSTSVSALYFLPEFGKGEVEYGSASRTSPDKATPPTLLKDQNYRGYFLGWRGYGFTGASDVGIGGQVELGYASPAEGLGNYVLRITITTVF